MNTSCSEPPKVVCYWDLCEEDQHVKPTLSKALDISSATARLAPYLLKALEILSNTTVRRSSVDGKDVKL